MSLAQRRPVLLPRRSLRWRMTLLYSVLFLAAGTGLLAITYLLMRSPAGELAEIDQALLPAQRKPRLPYPMLEREQELRAQALASHAAEMHELLVNSGIALAIMAVLAVALGWLVAGRMLRPLRTMTAATQRITEHNLHERLALAGPADEIKDLADTIDGLLHRLQAAFDAQRDFVANASHELRTPLTLNRALVEVTLANPDATVDELRTMGQDLVASGEQQEQLIEALLTLATSARGLDRHEPFDLAEIATDVLLDPHPEVGELGLEVRTAIGAAPTAGNPRLAKRLVVNLVDNALRHNESGGHVTVATRTESGQAILTIGNSGPIVPPADVDRIFRPFQRLRSDRANHAGASLSGGHGLGLSIVQSIAAAHGACLGVRTRPCGGLDVEVRFPDTSVSQARA